MMPDDLTTLISALWFFAVLALVAFVGCLSLARSSCPACRHRFALYRHLEHR